MSKPKKTTEDVPPEHMVLAWTLLLERTRFTGKSLADSVNQAFAKIEEKFNEDRAEHAQIRKDITTLRKEFNLDLG